MDQEQRQVNSEIMLFMEARPIYEHWKMRPQCHERIGDKHYQTVKTSFCVKPRSGKQPI